jgi:RNA polymerase sigma-70 factor, ECF subfamily
MFDKRRGDAKPEKAFASDTDEEQELVVLAQGNDLVAFEILYQRYNNRICRYLCRMVGDDGVGCELTQETFLKAWGALKTLRNPACFSSWLYRIATNSAYKYRQHVKLQWMVPLEEWGQESAQLSVTGPEEQVAQTELLTHALAGISPTYRSCLILAVVEKMPHRRIAEILDIRESCVSQYVSRGKKELRQMYYALSGETSSLVGGKSQKL